MGGEVLTNVWRSVREKVKKDQRESTLAELMMVFAENDCDVLDEVADNFEEGPKALELFDKASEERWG